MSAAAPAVQRQGSASEAGDEEDILDLLGDEEEAVDKAEVDAYEIDVSLWGREAEVPVRRGAGQGVTDEELCKRRR